IPVSITFPDAFESRSAAEGGDLVDFKLRSEFTHLSLLQVFDELLCLHHLRDVDTYSYQIEAVRKVLKQFRGRVLLADEVGLGKTVEAGMVLKEYLLRGMVERVLILTPASLVKQWQEEMSVKFDVRFATSYDSLLRKDPASFWTQPRIIASIATARRAEHLDRLASQSYDLVIVDEAHHLKNRSTANWKLVNALQKRFLLLLSATPVQNNLVELYNLLTLLKPGIFKTEKEFRAKTPTPREKKEQRAAKSELLANKQTEQPSKSEAPDPLPAFAFLIPVSITFPDAFESRSAAEGGDLVDFKLRSEFTHLSLLQVFDGLLGAGSKQAALRQLLQRNPAEKKIVFVHHRATVSLLRQMLRQEGMDFVVFEGAMTGSEKDRAIEIFRGEAPLLLSTESGGEGRNLQFCNTIINFDLPWNPMAIEQRIGRIHRIGQARDVFIFNLVVRHTLEQHILKILDEKINMFELVVGEIGAILGELDDDADFAEMVFAAWMETTESERQAVFNDLGEKLAGAKSRYDSVKSLDAELFGDEFAAS
ncbi:MAG: DEAD/DEAH box helicase family protein, partial [Acidobacteria bacterium]|nr:DEAD/DEAH box helicase family protein [Acidobacteriota bacterium]